MNISHPRFIGPYGTGVVERDALYFQREVKEFLNEVLSRIEIDDDEIERLHGLFNSSEDWYRRIASDHCRELRISSVTSSGSDIIDDLRATLAAWQMPQSMSQLDKDFGYEQSKFYRLIATRLRWLVSAIDMWNNIDDLKHQFLEEALSLFRANPRLSVVFIAFGDAVTDHGRQSRTRVEVLHAVHFLVNTWDNEHDKLWSKNEEKERNFEKLHTEIELLRVKLRQAADLGGDSLRKPDTDVDAASTDVVADEEAAVRQATETAAETNKGNVKEAPNDRRKRKSLRRQIEEESRKLTTLRIQMQEEMEEEVRAMRSARLQVQEELRTYMDARLQAQQTSAAVIANLESVNLQVEEELRTLQSTRLEAEKDAHKCRGMRLQVEEEMNRFRAERLQAARRNRE